MRDMCCQCKHSLALSRYALKNAIYIVTGVSSNKEIVNMRMGGWAHGLGWI